jgi:DNA-binding NarL/FixJ family response regulator
VAIARRRGGHGEGNMTEQIRLMIVDDHAPFRAGLRNSLADLDDIRIVAECADGACALADAVAARPAVVLMDLQMPGENGIDTTRALLKLLPQCAILMLTMFDNDESVFEAMQAGARGYLLKGAGRNELVSAVRAAAQGEAVFGQALAQRMQSYFSQSARPKKAALPQLTERERDVLDCLARGESTQEIAQSVSLSEKTVRNHLSNIFEKLQVNDRVRAALIARDAGLGGKSKS